MEHIAFLFLFVSVGSFAGFLAGLLGIGGGILLVPLFLWVYPLVGINTDLIVHLTFGTSLAVILPTSFVSTLTHRKHGNIDWHQVFYLSLGAIAGALVGSGLAALLSGDVLKTLFGVMQILVAIKFFLPHTRSDSFVGDIPSSWALAGVGFAGGLFSSFFGVGGGIVAVPLMLLLLKLPIHRSVGNSSALIVVSSFFGVAAYIFHGLDVSTLPPFSFGYVHWAVALLVAPFSMYFAKVGAGLAGRFSHDKLIRVFAVLLMFVGVRLVFTS